MKYFLNVLKMIIIYHKITCSSLNRNKRVLGSDRTRYDATISSSRKKFKKDIHSSNGINETYNGEMNSLFAHLEEYKTTDDNEKHVIENNDNLLDDLMEFIEENADWWILRNLEEGNHQLLNKNVNNQMNILTDYESQLVFFRTIREQSSILLLEASKILERHTKLFLNFNKIKFDETDKLFTKYVRYSKKDNLQDRTDYPSLDQKINNLLFDTVNFENGEQSIFVLSESKVCKFLKLSNSDILQSLFFEVRDPCDLLNVIEFFKFHKYYKEIPELIILERIRFISFYKSINAFKYLRCLNVLLDYYFKNQDNLPGFKDKIILTIEKILYSITDLRFCGIKKMQDISIVINPCDKKHENNYLYIFIPHFDYNLRNRLVKHDSLYAGKNYISDKIIFFCLHLLYNHILLNNYLFDQRHEKEKIDDFIAFTNQKDVCTNCVMEKCINIISEKQTTLDLF